MILYPYHLWPWKIFPYILFISLIQLIVTNSSDLCRLIGFIKGVTDAFRLPRLFVTTLYIIFNWLIHSTYFIKHTLDSEWHANSWEQRWVGWSPSSQGAPWSNKAKEWIAHWNRGWWEKWLCIQLDGKKQMLQEDTGHQERLFQGVKPELRLEAW